LRLLIITPSEQQPGFEYSLSGRENLGVEYLLAAVRRAGHQADSLNQNLPGEPRLEEIDLLAYEAIGFSLPFWEHRREYVRLINAVFARVEAPLIAGGHSATLGPEYFLHHCPGLLGIVMGEGEETLPDLLHNLSNPQQTPGFYSRGGFARRSLGDIDALAPPARDELWRGLKANPSFKEAYIASTRGCHNACSFCSIPTYYRLAHGPVWRERSVAGVCREIDALLDAFPDLDGLSFTDDNFLGFRQQRRDRALQIARHIQARRPDLVFEITCRADSVDYETFAQLADLGLSGVYLGIEAGVQRLLDEFRKRTTVAENLRSISILSRLDIGCDVGFIMFCPSITLEEVRLNLEFLQFILKNYPIFVHPAAVFRSLRRYPTDLGRAAILGDDHDAATYREEPVNLLRRALESIWMEKFEAKFLGLEKIMAQDPSTQTSYADESRSIAMGMIDVALSILAAGTRGDLPSVIQELYPNIGAG
jgi:radical SAM superfamily enzyme YgiQ (UPF0313 family)